MKESSPPVSAMATPTNSSGNVVDEFEEAFQHCLNVLTKEEALPTGDKDELRTEVEQTTLRFVDLARQMEAFFLQKRFLLSALKPEMVVKEDINELRIELARKDELLKRHYEKINVWQNLLMDLQGSGGYSKSPAQVTGVVPPGTVAPGMSTPGGPSGVNVNLPPGAGGMMAGNMPPSQIVPNINVNNNPMSGGSMTMQQQLQQQLQQQQMQQQLQQQQLQQQQMQQMQVSGGMGGMGGAGGVMVPGSQQAMFMQQAAAMGGARAPPFGGQQNAAGVLQGPLAYLEKTTSNIDLVAGMTDGRR